MFDIIKRGWYFVLQYCDMEPRISPLDIIINGVVAEKKTANIFTWNSRISYIFSTPNLILFNIILRGVI
jgi:hypothetical protein